MPGELVPHGRRRIPNKSGALVQVCLRLSPAVVVQLETLARTTRRTRTQVIEHLLDVGLAMDARTPEAVLELQQLRRHAHHVASSLEELARGLRSHASTERP